MFQPARLVVEHAERTTPQDEPDGTRQLVGIRNRKDLESWLESRPREDAVALAARAALRVVPLLVTALDEDAEARRPLRLRRPPPPTPPPGKP